jgi:hypothetical protein
MSSPVSSAIMFSSLFSALGGNRKRSFRLSRSDPRRAATYGRAPAFAPPSSGLDHGHKKNKCRSGGHTFSRCGQFSLFFSGRCYSVNRLIALELFSRGTLRFQGWLACYVRLPARPSVSSFLGGSHVNVSFTSLVTFSASSCVRRIEEVSRTLRVNVGSTTPLRLCARVTSVTNGLTV